MDVNTHVTQVTNLSYMDTLQINLYFLSINTSSGELAFLVTGDFVVFHFTVSSGFQNLYKWLQT